VDSVLFYQNMSQFSGVALVGQNTTAPVFAPTDDAFIALGNEALEFYRSDKAATSNLLTGHVITHQIVSTVDMVNGTLYYTNPHMTPITTSIAQTCEFHYLHGQ
jgi:uncharacterized surface protein with fasciclin (FAS1) repeats